MARLATQSQTAATGLDLSADAVSMSLTRARRLVNLQLSRTGLVYTNVRLVDQLPVSYPGGIDGVGWYYQAALRNNPFSLDILYFDLLLWVTQGFLFGGRASATPLTSPVTAISFVGGGITGYCSSFGVFFSGRRVRFFSLGDEIIMVQEGGLLPLRAYFSPTLGQGFYRAGIEPPQTSNLTLSVAGTGLAGTWGYKLTFADERFRESSPTDVVSIALVNQGVHVVADNIGTFSPPATYGGSNLRYVYLYRNTASAPDVFYQIARHTIPALNPASSAFVAGDFYTNANAYDNATDAQITGYIPTAPEPGQNDPPLPASIGVVHKNRVFLNDINDANVLQISNQGSTTQFAALFIPDVPTTGGRFEIGTDQGNSITALVEFGSILAIFKRRGSYFLYGDTLSGFVVRPVHQRGCIAPDSAYRCDNVVCFLSDDGIYAAAYEGGDVVTKISKEIEPDLQAQSIEDREMSTGWYVDRSYHLAVGCIIYVYNFDAEGWTTYVFGSGDIRLGEGIPDASVTARVGFSDMGNSGLYGSVVSNSNCPDDGMDDSPPPCSATALPASLGFDGNGGTASLAITVVDSLPTTYRSFVPWLGITGPLTGNGTATVACEPNPTCFDRTGVVQVCQQQITVTQTRSMDTAQCPCVMDSLIPQVFSVSHSAQTVQTAFVEHAVATITVHSFASWLHPQAPVFGTPTTGTIDIQVDANSTCDDRTGQVQICDKLVTVNQAADPGCGCNVTISPEIIHTFPGDTNRAVINVHNYNNTPYPCTTDVAWITIVTCSGGSLAGDTTLIFDYDFTMVPDDTPGHIFICNVVFTIINDVHS